MNAIDINPAVISAIGAPSKTFGTLADSRRSRIAENKTNTNEKPIAAPNP
jgi:hypothetical protein